MRRSPAPVAVCVIRVERQTSGLAITVVVNPDIRQWSEERLYRTADIDEAVELMHNVIIAFRDKSDP